MTKIQSQYDAEIGELENLITKQRERLHLLKQKRAEETCQFKVGDKVINKRGQKGEVINIRDAWGEGVAILGLYKKDGTMGLRTSKTYSWESWRKVEDIELWK